MSFAPDAARVVQVMAVAYPFQLIIVAASFFLEGVSRPRRVMAVNLSILPLNAILAWILATGQFGMFAGFLDGDAFVWEIPLPQGTARHRVMRDADGRWVERGEFCTTASKPETPCVTTFTMSLAKVASSKD